MEKMETSAQVGEEVLTFEDEIVGGDYDPRMSQMIREDAESPASHEPQPAETTSREVILVRYGKPAVAVFGGAMALLGAGLAAKVYRPAHH